MKEALSEIIQLATVDSEPWVLMVADILKSFPETGSLNLDLEEQNPNVQDILGELREKGRDWECVFCSSSHVVLSSSMCEAAVRTSELVFSFFHQSVNVRHPLCFRWSASTSTRVR